MYHFFEVDLCETSISKFFQVCAAGQINQFALLSMELLCVEHQDVGSLVAKKTFDLLCSSSMKDQFNNNLHCGEILIFPRGVMKKF